MSKIINEQIEAYQANFRKHGNTPKGTFQNNEITQFERFEMMLAPLIRMKESKFSICDVGSGVCDLHKFLEKKGISHDYTGVEIVPEMVKCAQDLYPKVQVLEADVLSDSFTDQFDFVVTSGLFNLPGNVDRKEWEEFSYKLITKMFELSKIGCSFNTLSAYSTFSAPELYYVLPETMVGFIQQKLGRFYTVNTGYPLYETTYTIFKSEFLNQKYSEPEFSKYFGKK